uniref:Uncharacterized protein n=1 Tax=Candidatus Kentrum sp. LPFa TaxID=2126335 RepID=A0A450Y2G8_9GAMM|nr:MAG: hypothetical protein BECKLPF1236A_GA0070988_104043 [Candidatus Kentron sp. LPFa]VFK35728.1 MAG: hypothetical protein BECKLPF1236C_GA0070990_104133 [Candidatus Kentron sp. LPFa]
MFPVDGLLIVETFTRRALPLFIANRCGVPVPITRDAAIRTPLVTLVVRTRVLRCAFPQEPLIVARLVTCLPLCASMSSRTPGTPTLVFNALRAWPAPNPKDRPTPKIHTSRGYVSDSGHTPFTSLHLLACLLGFRLEVIVHFRAADYALLGRACRCRGSLTVGSIARLAGNDVLHGCLLQCLQSVIRKIFDKTIKKI